MHVSVARAEFDVWYGAWNVGRGYRSVRTPRLVGFGLHCVEELRCEHESDGVMGHGVVDVLREEARPRATLLVGLLGGEPRCGIV